MGVTGAGPPRQVNLFKVPADAFEWEVEEEENEGGGRLEDEDSDD